MSHHGTVAPDWQNAELEYHSQSINQGTDGTFIYIWHQFKLTDIWPQRTVNFFLINRHRTLIFWAIWSKPNLFLKIWVPGVAILLSKKYFDHFLGVYRGHKLGVCLIRAKKPYLWMQFKPLFIKKWLTLYCKSEKFSSRRVSRTTDLLLTD